MAFATVGRTTSSTLNIEFSSGSGVVSVDADTTPTLAITKNGSPFVIVSASGHPFVGNYEASWVPTSSGEYALVWSFTVSGTSYTVDDTVYALEQSSTSGTAGGSFTRDTLTSHAKVQLGYPAVCVELSDAHFEDAAAETELWIATHMGQVRKTTISLVSGTDEYELPSDCEAVADVALPQRFGGTLPLAMDIEGLEDFYYGQFFRGGSRSGGFNSDVYQNLQYLDMTQRTLSADTEHVWQEYDRKLLITPSNLSGTAIVWYISNEIDYTRLALAMKHLMRRYMVAQAMMMLGRIRSKYSEVPGSGGKISLNGSDLMNSAETELAVLDEKLAKLVPPMAFLTG